MKVIEENTCKHPSNSSVCYLETILFPGCKAWDIVPLVRIFSSCLQSGQLFVKGSRSSRKLLNAYKVGHIRLADSKEVLLFNTGC